jgi:hypothetical protein
MAVVYQAFKYPMKTKTHLAENLPRNRAAGKWENSSHRRTKFSQQNKIQFGKSRRSQSFGLVG